VVVLRDRRTALWARRICGQPRRQLGRVTGPLRALWNSVIHHLPVISKWSAKRLMGFRVIESITTQRAVEWYHGVRAIPPRWVSAFGGGALFDSPCPNASPPVASRKPTHSLFVAGCPCSASTGQEVDAVLGQELSHIANGDMVPLCLDSGVVTTFVIFLARVIGDFVDKSYCALKTARTRHGLSSRCDW